MLKANNLIFFFCLLHFSCSGDDSSGPTEIYGCTDPAATNFDLAANVDDGSCIYESTDISGCTDPEANNYNPDATIEDGSCVYSHFQLAIDGSGESHLIVLQAGISILEIGDEVGIFDANGLTNFNDCSNQHGEILVGAGTWSAVQLQIAGIGSIDLCAFPDGLQLPGYINGNEIVVKIWDISENSEYTVSAQYAVGSGAFGEIFSVISDLSPR